MPDLLLDLLFLSAGSLFLAGAVGYALVCERL